jgi:urease subunit beta
MVPGEIVVGQAPIDAGGQADVVVMVANTADRPIQVGSHFHFAETNRALDFDRAVAWGRRLAIPAGTSIRFEPGIEREVGLTPLRGGRRVPGLRGLVGGPLDVPPAPGA